MAFSCHKVRATRTGPVDGSMGGWGFPGTLLTHLKPTCKLGMYGICQHFSGGGTISVSRTKRSGFEEGKWELKKIQENPGYHNFGQTSWNGIVGKISIITSPSKKICNKKAACCIHSTEFQEPPMQKLQKKRSLLKSDEPKHLN